MAPLQEARFVLDVHLGKLAAYLRMLGFDTLYQSCFIDPELVDLSVDERRILLTRDQTLLRHVRLTQAYGLGETDSRRQAREVVEQFDLKRQARPFTRCMACNTVLAEVPKEDVRGRVPERVFAEQMVSALSALQAGVLGGNASCGDAAMDRRAAGGGRSQLAQVFHRPSFVRGGLCWAFAFGERGCVRFHPQTLVNRRK